MATKKNLLGGSVGSLAILIVFAVGLPGPASAVESGPYSMEILVDGRPLAEHAARGTRYVEALKGREYAVRLTNRTSERIGIALSVDGLNSIDAKTTGPREARKWILDPHESVTLSGWQTSSKTARRFFFTSEENSYGAWLGKTDNLGVIEAAVFRERRPDPPIASWFMRDQPTAAQPCPAAKGAEKRVVSDDLAATGIGRQVDHRVVEVEFEPEARPSRVLRIRYEYRDALVRLGVLPRWSHTHDDPLARRERAHGFEDSGFAPDPY